MRAYTIPVLKNSIAVMRLLAEGRGPATTKALEQTLGVSHSTMYRILQTLAEEDWVRQRGKGEFELSVGLLPLFQPLVRHELLVSAVRGPLEKLCRDTGLTCKLSVLQGNFAITLFRTESQRATSVQVKSGAAFHLALGSSGAVLLSGLDSAERKRIIAAAPEECWYFQTRADVSKRLAELEKTGACSDIGTYRPSIMAVSAPLRDRAGAVVAAVSMIGFREDFDDVSAKAKRRLVLEAAKHCGVLLQGRANADTPDQRRAQDNPRRNN